MYICTSSVIHISHSTVSCRKCLILYQGKHAHAHLVGGTTEEGAGAAQAEYEPLKDDGHKNTTKVGVVAADGKSELHSEQEQSDYVSINVFASFVHSLSNLVVMVGVPIAAIFIILRVYLKMAGLLNGLMNSFMMLIYILIRMIRNSSFDLQPDWKIVDPIVTILFVLPMFVLSLPVAFDVLLAIREGRPRWIRFDAVKARLVLLSSIASRLSNTTEN